MLRGMPMLCAMMLMRHQEVPLYLQLLDKQLPRPEAERTGTSLRGNLPIDPRSPSAARCSIDKLLQVHGRERVAEHASRLIAGSTSSCSTCHCQPEWTSTAVAGLLLQGTCSSSAAAVGRIRRRLLYPGEEARPTRPAGSMRGSWGRCGEDEGEVAALSGCVATVPSALLSFHNPHQAPRPPLRAPTGQRHVNPDAIAPFRLPAESPCRPRPTRRASSPGPTRPTSCPPTPSTAPTSSTSWSTATWC